MRKNSADNRFNFRKTECIRYAHMGTRELKTIGRRPMWAQARLAAAVGIAIVTVAPQECEELVIFHRMAYLVRLIEGDVKVDAVAHKSRSRHDRPAKPTKSSNVADPKSSGRKRTRKDSV